MSTAATVAAGILLLCAYMALIVGLRAFCSWSLAQAESRESIQSYTDAFPAHAVDVAALESAMAEDATHAETLAILDETHGIIRGFSA